MNIAENVEPENALPRVVTIIDPAGGLVQWIEGVLAEGCDGGSPLRPQGKYPASKKRTPSASALGAPRSFCVKLRLVDRSAGVSGGMGRRPIGLMDGHYSGGAGQLYCTMVSAAYTSV